MFIACLYLIQHVHITYINVFITCSLLSAIKSVRHIHQTVEYIQLRETSNVLPDRIPNNLPEGF